MTVWIEVQALDLDVFQMNKSKVKKTQRKWWTNINLFLQVLMSKEQHTYHITNVSQLHFSFLHCQCIPIDEICFGHNKIVTGYTRSWTISNHDYGYDLITSELKL